jgi:hypothetical protein
MAEQAGKFEEWALLELFGHQRLAGRVSEATIAGGAFVRVDVPDAKGRIVMIRYLGPAAIYSISPCDENVAVAAAQRIDAAPIQRYQLEQLATTRSLPYEADGDDE